VEFERVGGLAQPGRDIDALAEAGPELHRLAHRLRAGSHGH